MDVVLICYNRIYSWYRIAQKFDGRNFDVFDTFQPDSQNLTRQNFQVLQRLQ